VRAAVRRRFRRGPFALASRQARPAKPLPTGSEHHSEGKGRGRQCGDFIRAVGCEGRAQHCWLADQSLRNAARLAPTSSAISRRQLRLRAALSWTRISLAVPTGSGALAKQHQSARCALTSASSGCGLPPRHPVGQQVRLHRGKGRAQRRSAFPPQSPSSLCPDGQLRLAGILGQYRPPSCSRAD
jgi:hypothetical protein